jgi:hypothetical protein
VQLLVVGPHLGLGWDETVYLSQVDPHVPNFYWSPWRVWGVPVIMSPVVVFSGSDVTLRHYLAALSGVGLVLAFS